MFSKSYSCSEGPIQLENSIDSIKNNGSIKKQPDGSIKKPNLMAEK